MISDTFGIGAPASGPSPFPTAGAPSSAAAKAREAQKKAASFADFLAEARKTPQQRCKDEVMKEWGVTDASLHAMPMAQAKALMDRIDQEVARRMQGLDPTGASRGKAGANLSAGSAGGIFA